MNKNYIFILSLFILIIILLIIYYYYIYTNKINITIENFDDTQFNQKYNLLYYDENYEEGNNSKSNNAEYEIIDFLKMPYIKQIYIEMKENVPYDLKIRIKDINNYKEYKVDMKKYKSSIGDGNLTYSNNFLNLDNILDEFGNIISGNKVYFKSYTDFKIKKIYICGNINGINNDILINNNNEISLNDNNKKDYIINKISFKNDNNYDIKIYYNNNYDTETDYNNKEYITTMEKFKIRNNARHIFFFKPLLVNKLKIKNNNNNENINYDEYNIYGKEPNNDEIQNYKLENNLISYKDSLNPSTLCGINNLKKEQSDSMKILDVLNYNDKINTELKNLELNKYNIQVLDNQKNDIQHLINRINNYSNKYINQLKKDDQYNIKKYKDINKTIEFLKKYIDEKTSQSDLNIDINLT